MGNFEKDNGGQVQIDCPSPVPGYMGQQFISNLPMPLNLEEKKYLLAVERGDLANVRRMLQRVLRKKHFNINCVDPFGRGALTIAIDSENLEMVELLVVMGIDTKDGLLQAISAEFLEAVELLLEHEELIHKEGELYSWQKVDITTSMFTPEITPLILAAHKNNYEILKLLLDRGATLPSPHDIKCGCDECIRQSTEDSLRHSLCRVNQYRALASPSLIALSSSDPLLTAFQLSWDLRNLAFTEQECKSQYLELRRQCQQFAVDLLEQTRTCQELAIILNHDPDAPPYVDGDQMGLARLEAAIDYKQKKFVAHPNIQQLLASMWYDGVPGFRRKQPLEKALIIAKVALLFPFYCTLYMIAPSCDTSKIMRKPFMKFLIHSSSYLFFLFILILVSQRAEVYLVLLLGTSSMKQAVEEHMARQRGNNPTPLEWLVVLYVVGFIWEETQEIYLEGIRSYLKNMWNFIDFMRNSLYVSVIGLRFIAYVQQMQEIRDDPSAAYVPREQWHDFDPQLIAEGLFAAANVFSALKLVHMFSINPHLGPLQISLGRMVIDIVKFFFIYSLVLFAFACGLNQLLWYFADLEKRKCYSLPGELPDWEDNGEACMKWRRFGNLFESSQSLFWASFGMVGLEAFELTGIKSYTRFWGLLMFGSYSVINVIVLLNLLIAMMSNSYAVIEEHSDTEWKFARTKLWLSYFEGGGTLPPPFNIFPTMKNFKNVLGRKTKRILTRGSTMKRKAEKERDLRYTSVMRALVWRYVAAMHRKIEESAVTEDDVNEVKNDISTMRYEMLEIFEKSGMDVSSADRKEKAVLGKRMKVWERRLLNDFHVAPVEFDEEQENEGGENEEPLAKFKRIAKKVAADTVSSKWNEVMHGVGIEAGSQIGRCRNRESFKNQQNLRKAMEEARRFALKSPVPNSRCVSPIELDDPTADSLMQLLKNIQEEIGDLSPGDTLHPSQRGASPIAQLGVQLQEIISKSPRLMRSPPGLSPQPPVKHQTLRSPVSRDFCSPPPRPLDSLSVMNSTQKAAARTLPPERLRTEVPEIPQKSEAVPEIQLPPVTLEKPEKSEAVPEIQVRPATLKKPEKRETADEPDWTKEVPKVVKQKAPAAPVPVIDSPSGAIKCAESQMQIPVLSTTPPTPLPAKKETTDAPKKEPIKPFLPEEPPAKLVSPEVNPSSPKLEQKSETEIPEIVSEVNEEPPKSTSSPACLRPHRKTADITTVKRKPNSGWL